MFQNNNTLPCGKKDCKECEVCKYDLPLNTPFKHIVNDMNKANIVPLSGNPSTSRLILPSSRCLPPIGKATQLALPFREQDTKNDLYCNNCQHFLKMENGNRQNFNTRCTAEEPRPGGAYRVIKLNVYPQEKVQKPFWCPIIKKEITSGANIGHHSFKFMEMLCQGENKSATSDSQLSSMQQKIKELWLGMSGITAWDDIKIGCVYHLPPTHKKGRMNLFIRTKYCGSMVCEDIDNNNEKIWLYKQDEEYKFLSLVK